jgi:hypothetical protein
MNLVEKVRLFFSEHKIIKNNKRLVKKIPFLKMDANYKRTWLDEVPFGWQKLALIYFENIEKILNDHNANNYLRITEVKEKWGKLRIYYSFVNNPKYEQNKWIEDIDRLFATLEKESWKLCIDCGAVASYQTNEYVTPVCGKCKEVIERLYPNVTVSPKS